MFNVICSGQNNLFAQIFQQILIVICCYQLVTAKKCLNIGRRLKFPDLSILQSSIARFRARKTATATSRFQAFHRRPVCASKHFRLEVSLHPVETISFSLCHFRPVFVLFSFVLLNHLYTTLFWHHQNSNLDCLIKWWARWPLRRPQSPWANRLHILRNQWQLFSIVISSP